MRTSSSRRHFLRRSTGVVAGSILTGGLSIARAAHAAGSEQIKIALIGCGGRGMGAAGNCLDVKDNIKLVAVADAFEDNARRARRSRSSSATATRWTCRAERIFLGFDAYQKAIQAGIDLVLLVTPPGFRPRALPGGRGGGQARLHGEALLRRRPRLPLAPGDQPAGRAEGAEGGRRAQHAAHARLQRDGPADPRRRGRADFLLALLRQQRGRLGPAAQAGPDRDGVPDPQLVLLRLAWRRPDRRADVHMIDVANWAKGACPIEANGMGGRQVRTGKDHGQIYDHFFVEYTYADGTQTVLPGPAHPRLLQQRRRRGARPAGHGRLRRARSAARTRGSTTGPKVSGHAQEHVDLIAAIRKGEKYHEGWYGATSSMTAVLGRMACYSGQVVRWDEAVAKGPDEMPPQLAFDADPPVKPDAAGNYPVPMPGAS